METLIAGSSRTSRPTTAASSLVHGDYRIDNMIFSRTARACWR
jgi:aminoglycoside phosphotransferase (APT) family kinase protein